MKYSDLITRLRRLEDHHGGTSAPWPPSESTLGYHQWMSLGSPNKHMGFFDLLLTRADRFWVDYATA